MKEAQQKAGSSRTAGYEITSPATGTMGNEVFRHGEPKSCEKEGTVFREEYVVRAYRLWGPFVPVKSSGNLDL